MIKNLVSLKLTATYSPFYIFIFILAGVIITVIYRRYPKQWAFIRLGYIYASKNSHNRNTNKVEKLIQKSLNINISRKDIKKDLNYSNEFDRIYKSRNVLDYINNSLIFKFIISIGYFSAFLIFLHRTHVLEFNLSEFTIFNEVKDTFPYFELSFLNIVEFWFFIGLIIRFFKICLEIWALPDRRMSILNPSAENPYFLVPKIKAQSKNSYFLFRLGISIYTLFFWFFTFMHFLFMYLLLCQLELTSFIKTNILFECLDWFLKYITINLGFTNEISKVETSDNMYSDQKDKMFFDQKDKLLFDQKDYMFNNQEDNMSNNQEDNMYDEETRNWHKALILFAVTTVIIFTLGGFSNH